VPTSSSGPSPLLAAVTPARCSAMPSSSGMKPLAARATSSSCASMTSPTLGRRGAELGRQAGAAVEGGLVLEDLGVVLEHQLVEDDELPDPQQAERAQVGGVDDERLERPAGVVHVMVRDAHRPRRAGQAEERQPP